MDSLIKKISSNIGIIYGIFAFLIILQFVFYRLFYLPKYLYIKEMGYSASYLFFERFKIYIILYFLFSFFILICSFFLIYFSNIFKANKVVFGKIIYAFFIFHILTFFQYIAHLLFFIIRLKDFYSEFYYFKNFEISIFVFIYTLILFCLFLYINKEKVISIIMPTFFSVLISIYLKDYKFSNGRFIELGIYIIAMILFLFYIYCKEKEYFKQ